MNRSGLTISRIVANCHRRNFETLTPTLSKSFHGMPTNHVPLGITPRTIFIESHKRFLFSKKETEAEAPKAEEVVEEINESEKVLNEKIAELEERSADLLDKYRRSLADFENLRNRMNKQVADAKVFGIQGFCKDLLDVADVLNKAISLVPKEQLEKESQYLRDMHQGLQLTESQLLKVFSKHGLVQENPLGEKFDPNKHDALFQIPAPDQEPNTVLDVQKIGYILQGRTIRPAAVGVSRK
eukprot:GFUD01003709.1.p1 GENE.GFUD01003709.1~~GFUD01003709.1.p1  ORF type:complete len:241 (+),score=61.86 GFUD01003709.1:42-764(+)